MNPGHLTARRLAHAERNLPRYTSFPTALAFEPADGDAVTRAWLAQTGPDHAISVYAHVPFCSRLCWYCGCHTSVARDYERISAFVARLKQEAELWAEALGPHGGAAHLHFGGGSPNALKPGDFLELLRLLARLFRLRDGAEVAVELDPAHLAPAFAAAAGEAGVTRASLGVQTLDPDVQARINRIQPFEQIAAAAESLRAAGVRSLNFDLMYGLPGQTPENVAATATDALSLRPDRVALFGYAHVPWMKKHQSMIRSEALAGVAGRWAQAEAAAHVLGEHGYVPIGMDHYARAEDPLAKAAAAGRLRRNFQGYTDDPAPVLVGLGPSAIGGFPQGHVQNAVRLDHWGEAVNARRLPTARRLAVTAEDRLRAAVIERLMCDLSVDIGDLCESHGFPPGRLDPSLAAASRLQADGLCAVMGRTVTVPPDLARLVRVVAACFDDRLTRMEGRHARAV